MAGEKVIDIDSGKLMIATDIHGDWEDYQRVNELFNKLKSERKADFLVFSGDLIHRYEGEDHSVEIIDDLIGKPDIIRLLGNHELAHIYNFSIYKGGKGCTLDFEDAIQGKRDKYVDFIKQMPFMIRTAGGVLINHVGANAAMTEFAYTDYAKFLEKKDHFKLIQNIDHDKMLEVLKKEVKEYIFSQQGIQAPEDLFEKFCPLIGDKFGESHIGKYLWDVFFNKNELECGDFYQNILDSFLAVMSKDYKPQKFLISGHIPVPDGFETIEDKQLRISTSYGADEDKKVVAIVDAGRKYKNIDELVEGVVPLAG